MKKTRLLICFMLALVMLVGALPAFATEDSATDATLEATEETLEATEETKQEDETITDTPVTTTGPTTEEKDDVPEFYHDPVKCPSSDSKNGKHSQIPTGNKYDAEYHWYECKYCKNIIGEKHTFSEYKITEKQHSPYCTVCKKQYNKEDHQMPEEYDAKEQKVCAVCKRVEERPHEHQFEEKWSSNAFQHWHACTAAFGLKGTTFCKFDAFHKEVCTPEAHTANGFELFKQGGGECTVCKIKQSKFDDTVTEHAFDENGYCAYCQEQIDHISEWSDHEFDDNGICTVCGAEDVIPEERPGDAGIKWIVIIVIGVVGAASAAAVFLVKKKEK